MVRAVATGMGPWNRAGQIWKRGISPQGLCCEDVPDLWDLHTLASFGLGLKWPWALFWRSLLTWSQKPPLFLLLQKMERGSLSQELDLWVESDGAGETVGWVGPKSGASSSLWVLPWWQSPLDAHPPSPAKWGGGHYLKLYILLVINSFFCYKNIQNLKKIN